MEQPRYGLKSGLILSAVIALHAAMLCLLLARAGLVRIAVRPQSIELLWLPPAPKPVDSAPAGAARAAPLSARRKSVAPHAAPPAIPGSIAAPPVQDSNAIHPPIDWDDELTRAAREAVAAEADKHYREFNFPAAPAAPQKKAGIAWARPRFESQGGAMLVHLNNNCVLVFFPMPFVGCGIGHKPPNGDLFKNLKDGGSP